MNFDTKLKDPHPSPNLIFMGKKMGKIFVFLIFLGLHNNL